MEYVSVGMSLEFCYQKKTFFNPPYDLSCGLFAIIYLHLKGRSNNFPHGNFIRSLLNNLDDIFDLTVSREGVEFGRSGHFRGQGV